MDFTVIINQLTGSFLGRSAYAQINGVEEKDRGWTAEGVGNERTRM